MSELLEYFVFYLEENILESFLFKILFLCFLTGLIWRILWMPSFISLLTKNFPQRTFIIPWCVSVSNFSWIPVCHSLGPSIVSKAVNVTTPTHVCIRRCIGQGRSFWSASKRSVITWSMKEIPHSWWCFALWPAFVPPYDRALSFKWVSLGRPSLSLMLTDRWLLKFSIWSSVSTLLIDG